MADWANFALYMISKLVTAIFGMDLGVGFSLGDAEVALFIIGLIASAFIIRFGTMNPGSHIGDRIAESERFQNAKLNHDMTKRYGENWNRVV